MEQQIVNEIYWTPDLNSAFNFGSNVKVDHLDRVSFYNRLMTPGVALNQWPVAANYQGAKTVPQLPHLRINHQYRMVLHATAKPANSLMMRLIFTDIQGNEIKRFNYKRSNVYFTVPAETIGITLQLINAGNEQVNFQRIEICEKNVDPAANQDLWFQPVLNNHKGRPRHLLIVPANRRAKKTYPLLEQLVDNLAVQVVLVDYQYAGNLTEDLEKYIKKHRLFQARVISCDPQFDVPVLDLQKKLLTIKSLVTSIHKMQLNMFDSWDYDLPKRENWVNPNLVEPNWRAIIDAIKTVFGGN